MQKSNVSPDYVSFVEALEKSTDKEKPSVWGKWKNFSTKAATLLARILLTVFYWIFVTPFAIGVRLCSDVLGLKSKKGGAWTPSHSIDAESQF
ncbi:hypothetical protein IJT93_02810 [bacterium]|nr:hypothetical protein [bacterium]